MVEFFLLGTLSIWLVTFLYWICPSHLLLQGDPLEETAKLLVFLALVTMFRSIRESADGIHQVAHHPPSPHGPFIDRGFRVRLACLLQSQEDPPGLGIHPALGDARREWPFVVRDPGKPEEARRAIDASLVYDPANPRLHPKAAHFRLRAGDPIRAAAHLDRYLDTLPNDPYGLGMKGAAFVLWGNREAGEAILARANAMMRPHTRRPGGFDESMLRTWLVLSELGKERLDPRRQPPVSERVV